MGTKLTRKEEGASEKSTNLTNLEYKPKEAVTPSFCLEPEMGGGGGGGENGSAARGEVLYETKRHASGPYSSNYPPQLSKASEGGGGRLSSLLPFRGFSQIKERWSGKRNTSKLSKSTSLFISPHGDYVAVATGNRITILRKEDDYQEPYGVFTSGTLGLFTCGAWSEAHDILGLSDHLDTLYFIKPNGEEITRIAKRQLNVSAPMVGLFLREENKTHESCLCIVLAQDGFQQFEVSRRPNASISSMQSNSSTSKSKFPDTVFCFDFNPERDLLVLVSGVVDTLGTARGNTGSCCLHLWSVCQVSDPEELFSIQFDGIYVQSDECAGQLAYPKVLMSPHGNLVATLDIVGSLHIFELDRSSHNLSSFTGRDMLGSQTSNMSSQWSELVSNVADFTWWSDHIMTVAKKSGMIDMLDVLTGLQLEENSSVYSKPVLDRVQLLTGHIFLLESKSSEHMNLPSDHRESSDSEHMQQISGGKSSQSQLHWTLISLSKRSVPKMYKILIHNHQYRKALEFADRYGLDKDEVLKSQWLQSLQGINEISMFLGSIKDHSFVLSECLEKIGPTEDSVKASLAYGLQVTDRSQFLQANDDDRNQIWDWRMNRLQLLQFGDRLETYLGINMGRFSALEYGKFRVMPLKEAALTLAESGKIGSLNLLFKRHPYSLSTSILEILASIPETVHVQIYGQLLPGRSPPANVALRKEDWVECEKMVSYIRKLPEIDERAAQVRTEPIIKRTQGYMWPSPSEISMWYKNRALEMDAFSGQLDYSVSLLDFACRKGISELEQFKDDVLLLYHLIYSDEGDGQIFCNMSLSVWEKLSDYEKFRMMLQEAIEQNVLKRLRDKAIPFMKNRLHATNSFLGCQVTDDRLIEESLLVRWMKENASENKLELCLIAFEEGCNELEINGFFKDENEAVDCALQCIYLCIGTDRWNTMASLLSKLPSYHNVERQSWAVDKRLKTAEGHIEAGRLLAFYQVPKPIGFFLEAHADEKGVKQILRLILSKFVRRQPGRSDTDWANMWRDMQLLREKAFPFLDPEFMLMEFCRGLLKAGKFSLARNYLKGTSSVAVASEKAENLVIQAAREYFFSASSLSSSEIWKANECLNLFPNSSNVKAEADIIDAVTVKLPNLGVTLLPMQFRQIKDPMEIIKMAITSQAGYLNVDDIIDVAKLLGMRSPDEISAVEEAIAREAAVAGDLQSAFDLCLVLARKGHGVIWDLCAAIARGPALDNMDINSRKLLLGFSLSHCDEESIGELFHAWKDLDIQGQCQSLMTSTGISHDTFSLHGSSAAFSAHHTNTMHDSKNSSESHRINSDDQDAYVCSVKETLASVTKNLPAENGTNMESILKDNGKILSFAAFQLPWLLDMSTREGNGEKVTAELTTGKPHLRFRKQATLTILSWLARNGFPPKDNVIAALAKSVIEPPVTEEEDLVGCSFLLNLVDAFSGVQVIEEQLNLRTNYQEICSIMNVGTIYSALHDSGLDCKDPARRRELLLSKFREKQMQRTFDGIRGIDKVQTTFWKDWKLKLEEKKCVAERSRMVEEIIPGVETARFLSGDSKYIESAINSLIESLKLEKKHIINDVFKLADAYELHHQEVLQHYMCSILISDVWTNEDIMAEIWGFRGKFVAYAHETIKSLCTVVYPAVDGRNKQRLAFIYDLLSDCYLSLDGTKGSLPAKLSGSSPFSPLDFAHFCRVLEHECRRVSFIQNLNFKNVAGLDGLNLQCFSSEIYAYVDESSLEALAKMVQELASVYNGPVSEVLISWQDVYKHYVLSSLSLCESKARTELGERYGRNPEKFQELITMLEQNFCSTRNYTRLLTPSDALEIMKHYFTMIVSLSGSCWSIQDNSTWQDCLVVLLNFWIGLAGEMEEVACSSSLDKLLFDPECLSTCLRVLMNLVMEDSISPYQGWGTIIQYVNSGLIGGITVEIQTFCRAMVLSGCWFGAISEVFYQTKSQCAATLSTMGEVLDLPGLYLTLLEPILVDLVNGSNEHQLLYHLLSSLVKLEGKIEDLQRVRNAVWERLGQFSDNLQLPSQVRVFVLEVMQFIAGRSIKGFSNMLESNVLQWEGWDDLVSTKKESETIADHGIQDHKESSTRYTSTLVALRSSQITAAISANVEITADDLSTVDSAVSCYLKLCEISSTSTHMHALIALLEEWDRVFSTRGDEVSTMAEAADVENDWGSDDWDEGWESFPEEEAVQKEKAENCRHLHPLHLCWTETFKSLIKLSQLDDVIRLADRALEKSSGTLLDEEEARSVILLAQEVDCFASLGLSLLLPYEPVQRHCLDVLEEKLEQGQGMSDIVLQHHAFLMLALSSGIISSILTGSLYRVMFSFVCYVVGNLSRRCQESELARHKKPGTSEAANREEAALSLFRRIMFPAFISEHVEADQHVLAGFLVTKFVHTNAALSLINVADATISRYLESQSQALESDKIIQEQMGTCELKNAAFKLREKLGNLIQSALGSLSANSR